MLLKYFYDEQLAHASYLVGCQRAQQALVIDPGRHIGQYLNAAEKEGLRLVAAAETHIHADFVSGARELAERVGAKIYVSDEGPAEWKYQYVSEYDHQLLREGERFHIGKIKLEVLHTPGHTPESLSFVLTDQGGGADEPMGIFTGDFVFVGSIGRPDLLEEAAGMADTAEPAARDLFQSAQRFKQLPEFLQVWPAHGAGSACGKGLGAIPSSTVGYEKRFNPALQFSDEEAFVQYILDDQPEAPKYFAEMKRVNKEGPKILGEKQSLSHSPIESIESAVQQGTVLDLAASADFKDQHVPGTINIPLAMLSPWAGWLVDYSQPVFLIANDLQSDEGDAAEAIRVLQKMGIDELAGVFSRHELIEAGKATQSYPSATPEELASKIDSGAVKLLDVRSDEEWNAGHINEANHFFLGRLQDSFNKLPEDRTLVVQCQSGARSAIAASVLQAKGFDVVNLSGGYRAWVEAGLGTNS